MNPAWILLLLQLLVLSPGLKAKGCVRPTSTSAPLNTTQESSEEVDSTETSVTGWDVTSPQDNSTTTTEQHSSSTPDNDSTVQTHQTDSPISSSTQLPDVNLDDLCASRMEEYLPHPYDCHLYIYCGVEKPHELSCGELNWDAIENACQENCVGPK